MAIFRVVGGQLSSLIQKNYTSNGYRECVFVRTHPPTTNLIYFHIGFRPHCVFSSPSKHIMWGDIGDNITLYRRWWDVRGSVVLYHTWWNARGSVALYHTWWNARGSVALYHMWWDVRGSVACAVPHVCSETSETALHCITRGETSAAALRCAACVRRQWRVALYHT